MCRLPVIIAPHLILLVAVNCDGAKPSRWSWFQWLHVSGHLTLTSSSTRYSAGPGCAARALGSATRLASDIGAGAALVLGVCLVGRTGIPPGRLIRRDAPRAGRTVSPIVLH
jgi:hypothetical protein